MTAALETDSLGRRYAKKWALRDCTLAVEEGSITGLVGPNGAGKSTLLRLAAGISRPDEGSVGVFGKQVSPSSTDHLGRIGYLDQLRPLYGGLKVRETLELGKRLNVRWDQATAAEQMSDLEIPLEQKVGSLSVGQQAQVALALCLSKQPDLLLLDEPVASLDPLARHQLMQVLLSAVAERAVTVLMSSHIVSDLEPVCDRLIIMSASQVRVAGSIEAILGDHKLITGPKDFSLDPGMPVISATVSARQQTLLVRGEPPEAPELQILQPTLEEIVLGYLGKAPQQMTAVLDEGDAR